MPSPYSPVCLWSDSCISPGLGCEGGWGREAERSRGKRALFRLESYSLRPPQKILLKGFVQVSEGLTWGGTRGCQLVLTPGPFVGVQGWWDPGG